MRERRPPEQEIHTIDWSLWFQWLLATMLGWVIGWLFVGELGIGVVIGLAQWLVLRQWVSQASWWIWATTVGWAMGWAVVVTGFGISLNADIVATLVAGAILGLMLGVGQWLILRRWVNQASLWIPLSLVGWSIGLAGIFGATLIGAVVGVVTGFGLDFLLRNPASEPRSRGAQHP